MLSVGCAPSIESVTIVPGADFQVVAVEARINESSSATSDPPQLAVAVLPNASPTFVDAGPLVSAGSDLYRREAMAMPPGEYRAEVTLPYRVVFSSTVRTVTRSVDFTIAAPEGCFLFDIPGTDTGGWTSEGFFEITPANQRRDLCTGQTPLIASAGSNFPSDFSSPLNTPFDSLMLPLNQPCFATPPANMQSNFVIADFVSPDLSGQPGWGAANGFELQAQTQGYLSPNADEQVRLQLIATSTTGETFAETDASGAFAFHNLTGPWQALSMTRDGLQIARVRARVFVPRTHPVFGPDWRIAIDRVCPRPQ
ncbi:MAG TPA: hypothetical protein VMM93_05170 [Vicinamibacterales bacterium]|nr:hypothetical protein [Vicinamibacterales bacterium]